jgi:hypothetical protein
MYAKGKKALGICDRCGFTYKLSELKYEIEDSIRNGLRVCSSCFDPDHPQFKVGELQTSDPQSLFNPRTDTGEKESTTYYGLFDDTTFIVGPTPNDNFVVELHYFYRPASITAGEDSGTTWLSTNAMGALLYGTLLESYVYMKGEPDLMTQYERRFLEALARLKNLAEGDNTVDTYRDDVVRVQRT